MGEKNRTLKSGKLAFRDLLVSGMLFAMVTSIACPLVYAGTWTKSYVAGINNQATNYDFGVKGYQQTVSVSFYSGSAVYSNVALAQSGSDFFSVGFMQGTDINYQLHSTPVYYVDRMIGGSYQIWMYGQATTGENHLYSVFTDFSGQTMYAAIDGVTKKTESGYPQGGKESTGQTETHNTDDVMNHHHWGMQYRSQESRWFSFTNDAYLVNSPYHQTVTDYTEWTAWR
jgi:hypothetical protein